MEDYEVKIIHSSRRKRAALYVHEKGQVELRLPTRFPKTHIPVFLKENEAWIQAKLAELRELYVPAKSFQPGEEFFVLGFPVTLCLTSSARKIIFSNQTFWAPEVGQDRLKKSLVLWYRKKAEEVFARRLSLFSEKMDCVHSGLQVKEYSARWGTCFPDGNIALNWRLIMAPIQVIDYVVVHELAHIKHNGHGKAFWNKVGQTLPDYKERIQALHQWSSELFSI